MKYLKNLDLAKVINACGDFVTKLDAHPLGGVLFLGCLLIIGLTWLRR